MATLLGYLSPALAMLLGAGLGSLLVGRPAAAALGAIAGFLAALVLARCLIARLPAGASIPAIPNSPPFPKEPCHD